MLNVVEIDLNALRHNYNQVRRLIPPGTKIMAVIKSDAYGHGMVRVARELVSLGVDFFGVGDVNEGLVLRRAKIFTPTVILLGITEGECPEVIQNDLFPAVYDLNTAQKLSEEAQKAGIIQKIHLKIDTGMGRLGIPINEVVPFFSKIRSLKSLDVEGLFSHLSSANESCDGYTQFQLDAFKKAIDSIRKMGFNLRYNHIANSAALIQCKESHFDMVRPGIMLYGSLPSRALEKNVTLKPVMTFKSRIVQIKTVPPNSSISYGRTYITERESIIATIPVGYDNGYMRSLSNKGEVLIAGKRTRILGAVCMNLLMADITDVPDVQVNDEVVLLGRQADEVITCEEIAEKAGTISYEIYCALGGKNQKIYKRNLD